jgi:hypothetical protein
MRDRFFCIPLAMRDDREIVLDDSAAFDCPTAESAITAAQAVSECSGTFCGCVAFARIFNKSGAYYEPVEILKRCTDLEWSPQHGAWVA